MARLGTRPIPTKTPGDTQTSADQNYVDDKSINPGVDDAWSSVVKFDDEYFPPDKTMTGAIEYTIDATNAGTGNGRKDTVIGDGNTITFTGFTIRKSSLTPTSNVVTTVNGNTYTIIFLRTGGISEVYLVDNAGATPGFALALSNFSIEDANKDRVYFDTNQAPIGTTYAGFTLATPSKTITGITFNTGQTTGHYFTVSVAYVVGDTSPTIAYDGTDDWTGTGGALAAFTTTAITNNIGLTQLSALTLGTVTPASGQVTIDFTNPNASNEDQNQFYYKLNTEPTVWTPFAPAAVTGATQIVITGLTDGLLYNFYGVAEGDDITYSDSDDSNVVNGTPGTVYTFANTHSLLLPTTSDSLSVTMDTIYPKNGGEQPFTFEAWIKTPASLDANMLFGLYNGGSELNIYFIVATTGQATFKIRNGSTNFFQSAHASTGQYGTDEWIQLIGTYSGDYTDGAGSTLLYLNGAQGGTNETSGGTFTGITDLVPTANLAMPSIGADDGYMVNFVRWYDKALNQTEINQTNAVTNKPRDISGEAFFSNCVLELQLNNNYISAIGPNGSAVGSPTFNTDLPV
jgi:hypothetical protein